MFIRARTLVLLAALTLTQTAWAAAESGSVLGWVEDTRGAPVSGAIVSIFGKGLGGSGLTTLSDSAGRFFVGSLPPGSYTVRTLGAGHRAAAARQVTVLPNQDATFTVSLTPLAEAAAAAGATPAADHDRELRWLVRHKRRSALDEIGQDVQLASTTDAVPSLASAAPDLAGTFELMAFPTSQLADNADNAPNSLSVVRLNGHFADSGTWSVGGLLAESGSTSWRMAAEFVIEPGGGHRIQAGSGYGISTLRPGLAETTSRNTDRGVGALFVEDRWQSSERFATTIGARYSYIGFLEHTGHLDPAVAMEFKPDANTRLVGAVRLRTLAPGGDLLTLSTVATSPAITWASMSPRLQPERTGHYELALEQTNGPVTIRAHTFYEDVRNTLLNSFAGEGTVRSLNIANGGRISARGMGLTLGRRFGKAVNTSMTYSYGHRWRSDDGPGRPPMTQALADGDFHDVSTRVETWIDETGTRLVAYYRFNALTPDDRKAATVVSRRFDVQLSQGLPFLGNVTRADWDILVAVRNLFYETEDGAMLDEVAVANPPKRVLGGISVRF